MSGAKIDEKTFTDLQARAARLRCRLLRVPDGPHEVYLICRDSLWKELASAADIAAWLKLAGGPAA